MSLFNHNMRVAPIGVQKGQFSSSNLEPADLNVKLLYYTNTKSINTYFNLRIDLHDAP